MTWMYKYMLIRGHTTIRQTDTQRTNNREMTMKKKMKKEMPYTDKMQQREEDIY